MNCSPPISLPHAELAGRAKPPAEPRVFAEERLGGDASPYPFLPSEFQIGIDFDFEGDKR